jgi:hypothetical protein
MALFTRKTIIVAAKESTYGTDATPAGSDAILVSEPTITPLAGNTVQRNNAQPYFGARQQVHVGSHVQVSFSVELAGHATEDTAPLWGILLEASSFVETINTGTDIDYDPNSTFADMESLTIYFFRDGQKHAMTGARGTYTIDFTKNDFPRFNFTFTGLWVDPASVADPTPVFTGWVDPIEMSNTNTTTASLHSYDVILESLSIDIGNTVIHSDRPNEEAVKITDRNVTGSISFVAPALSAKNFFTIAKANTLGALSIVHGTADGNKVTISASNVQIIQPTYADVDGEVMITANLSFVPSDSGNDEIQITSENVT